MKHHSLCISAMFTCPLRLSHTQLPLWVFRQEWRREWNPIVAPKTRWCWLNTYQLLLMKEQGHHSHRGWREMIQPLKRNKYAQLNKEYSGKNVNTNILFVFIYKEQQHGLCGCFLSPGFCLSGYDSWRLSGISAGVTQGCKHYFLRNNKLIHSVLL